MTTPSKVEVLETLTRAKDALDSSAGILNKLYERFPEVTVYYWKAFRMHKCADSRSDEMRGYPSGSKRCSRCNNQGG